MSIIQEIEISQSFDLVEGFLSDFKNWIGDD